MAEWRNAPDGATSKPPFEMGVSDLDKIFAEDITAANTKGRDYQ